MTTDYPPREHGKDDKSGATEPPATDKNDEALARDRERMLGNEWRALGRTRMDKRALNLKSAGLLARDKNGFARLLTARPELELHRAQLMEVLLRAAEDASETDEDITERLKGHSVVVLDDTELNEIRRHAAEYSAWKDGTIRPLGTQVGAQRDRCESIENELSELKSQMSSFTGDSQAQQDLAEQIDFFEAQLDLESESHERAVKELARGYAERPDQFDRLLTDGALNAQDRRIVRRELQRLKNEGQATELFNTLDDLLAGYVQANPDTLANAYRTFPLDAERANEMFETVSVSPEGARAVEKALAELSSESLDGISGTIESIEWDLRNDPASTKEINIAGQFLREGPVDFARGADDAVKRGNFLEAAGRLTTVATFYLKKSAALSDPTDYLLRRGYDSQAEKLTEEEGRFTAIAELAGREANRRIFERLKNLAPAETALDSAISSANPQDAAIISQREARRKALTGKIVGSVNLGGDDAKSQPRKVTFKDGGEAIAKGPETELRDNTLPETWEYGYSLACEKEAEALDAIAGFEVVPASILDVKPDETNFVQEWSEGESLATIEWVKLAGNDVKYAEGLANATALKVIMGERDGHDGQFLMTPAGKVLSIDAGMSRKARPQSPEMAPLNMRRIFTLWSLGGKPVPPETRAGLERVIKMFKTSPEVKNFYAIMYGEQAADQVMLDTVRRAQDMLDKGFPPFEFLLEKQAMQNDINTYVAAGGRREDITGEINKEAFIRVNCDPPKDEQERAKTLQELEDMIRDTKIKKV